MFQHHRPWRATVRRVLFAVVAVMAATIFQTSVTTEAVDEVTFPAPVRPTLIDNGSFESPLGQDGSTQELTSVPGWSLIPGASIAKVHNNTVGPAADGRQFLELDGSYGIMKVFPTLPGTVYELTFSYAPLPGLSSALSVGWNGAQQGVYNANGTGISTTSWSTSTISLRAVSAESVVMFATSSAATSHRIFLDAVTIQAAQCKTIKDGSWSDASIWSCAGSQQLPGPGNHVDLFHNIDTTGVSGDFSVEVVQIHQGAGLLRIDASELSIGRLHMASGSTLTASDVAREEATLSLDDGVVAGTIQYVKGITVAGSLELTGEALVLETTITIAGPLVLRQQARIHGFSRITAATADLFDQATVEWSELVLTDHVIAHDTSIVSDSSFTYIADLLGQNPGLLIEQGQHAEMLNNLAQVITQLQSPFGNPIMEMQNYLNPLAMRVAPALLPDHGLFLASGASTQMLAGDAVTAQSVILKSDTPLTLSSLMIEAAQTLELAPGTTVTLDGLLTNHGSIVVPETSSFTTGTNAVVAPGTSGTLTDSVPATVGPLQVTSPVAVGGLMEVSAQFSDTPLDTHEAVWSWGDGTTEELAVDETTGTASASHRYTSAGTYTVELVVRDAGGNASIPVIATVVVGENEAWLEVRTDLAPNIAPGRFNLLIANEIQVSNQGDDGTTGRVSVAPGTTSFGEQATAGTTLSNYTITVHCTERGETGPGLPTPQSGVGTWLVELARGDDAVCVITNRVEIPEACAGMTFDKILLGSESDDRLDGSAQRELILGNLGNDVLDGGAGNDCVGGGEGNDTISGGAGDDRLLGGTGNDRLVGDSGRDIAVGGSQTDACDAEIEITCESRYRPVPLRGPDLNERVLNHLNGLAQKFPYVCKHVKKTAAVFGYSDRNWC